MANPLEANLLARLVGPGKPNGGADPRQAVPAAAPVPPVAAPGGSGSDDKLAELLSRINSLTGPPPEKAAEPGAAPQPAEEAAPVEAEADAFVPVEPVSIAAAELTESEVEALTLKYLLARGDLSGRQIADQIKLPFVLLDELLRRMKNDRLVTHRGAAAMSDYQYELSDFGRERARRLAQHCTYFGAAPVSLRDYVASVAAQSLQHQHPKPEDLRQAFGDLLLSERMMERLGPAVNSSRGLFLYGAPGNGKTSIAQRVTQAFGQAIWIPRAIGIDGEIIRLFDPVNHEEMPLEPGSGLWDQRQIDKRWVRIRRPTIVAGGELTMAALEVTINTSTGISEAPLQLKSNCGTLVIDDFGRQRMRIEELLNRWIVPLEMRFDFLNLPNGKKITVPFDQLIIFSTNLEPRALVDEAFLRRVPYKIEVTDPSEQEFRDLIAHTAGKLGFEYSAAAVDHLIQTHYKQASRPFRFCQPRDLLMQVRNYCVYHNRPLELTAHFLDLAVENYFGVM